MVATLLTMMGAGFDVGDMREVVAPSGKTFNLFQVANSSFGPLMKELRQATERQV